MLVHKLGHYPTRFRLDGEIPPLYGYGTFASRLERMHARGDTCKHLYIPTSHHTPTHTYARGTCKVSSHSNVLVVFLRRNPDLCAHSDRLPLDVPLTGVDRRSSLFFCVCLGHRVMLTHLGSLPISLSYPVSPRRGDSTLIRV